MSCTCSNPFLRDGTDLADSFQEALGKHAFQRPAHTGSCPPALPPVPRGSPQTLGVQGHRPGSSACISVTCRSCPLPPRTQMLALRLGTCTLQTLPVTETGSQEARDPPERSWCTQVPGRALQPDGSAPTHRPEWEDAWQTQALASPPSTYAEAGQHSPGWALPQETETRATAPAHRPWRGRRQAEDSFASQVALASC